MERKLIMIILLIIVLATAALVANEFFEAIIQMSGHLP